MIEALELSRHSLLRHAFFTREGGHSSGIFASLNCGFGSGDDKPTVSRNRAAVSEKLGVESMNLLTTWQHHSSDTIAVTAPWDSMTPPRGDAIVTATSGIAIAVLTADCAPILLADPEARVIGAAHAGWKGALAGITDSTVAAMERLGARRSHITAVIGPTISQAVYEVGPELFERFADDDRSNAEYFAPSHRGAHHMFDLPRYLAGRLTRAGLAAVVDLAICTYRDEDRFFSYRRATHRGHENYGRQISAICLAADRE
jgi:YfiH family protein